MKKIEYRRKISALGWCWYIPVLLVATVCIAVSDKSFQAYYVIAIIILTVTEYFMSGYSVSDGKLLVYDLLQPYSYPVDKITAVSYNRHRRWYRPLPKTRLEVTFADRSVMKSNSTLEIVPDNCEALIAGLLEINPDIQILNAPLHDTSCQKG